MNPPLIEVLGVQWDLKAPIVAICWGQDGRTVAYAMGDGRVALADAQWPQGPRIECRQGGGVSLVTARSPAAAPAVVACHGGSCHALAAEISGSFVTGGDDGRVMRVRPGTEPEELARVPDLWIDAVACGRSGDVVYAAGKRVARRRENGTGEIELPASATALAFCPEGRTLGIAHSGGVTLWHEAALPRRLAWAGFHRAIAWSPDGAYVVTGMQENALHGWRVRDGGDMEMAGYPGQPLSLAFTADGAYLTTSGALRPVCWDFARPGASQAPRECGIQSKAPVTCVACHPRFHVIVAGYHSGAITLCQPDSDSFLLIKGAGGGALSALAWSPDGQRLAFGTQDGWLGWVELPDPVFRNHRPATARPHSEKESST